MKDLTEELRMKYIGKRDPIGNVVSTLTLFNFSCTELFAHKGDLALTVLREGGKGTLDTSVVVEIYTGLRNRDLKLVAINNNVMTYNFTKYYYTFVNTYTGLGAKILLGPEDVGQLGSILSIIYDSSKFFEYEQRLLELRFELSVLIEDVIYPALKERGFSIYKDRQFSGARIDFGIVPKLFIRNSCMDYVFYRTSVHVPYIGFGVHPITGKFLALDVRENNLQNYHQVDLKELSKEELVRYIYSIII
jgi:hypothetical protein